MLICYYCREARKDIRNPSCSAHAGPHYFVKKADPVKDRSQRQIPRLERKRVKP